MESGGTAEDVMQSSESMGLPPNSLDTESSIKQRCKYFASLLSSAESQGIEDINVVVQSYNYGGGYIGYVAKNGKKHSFTLAENFACDKSGGKKSPTRTLSLSPAMVAGVTGMEIMFYCGACQPVSHGQSSIGRGWHRR